MFKTKLIYYLIIVFLTSCSSQSDYAEFGLKNDVQSFYENNYVANKDGTSWVKGEKEFYGHYKVDFDQAGRYQRIQYMDEEGVSYGTAIVNRENSDLIEEKFYDSEGKFTSYTTFHKISKKELVIDSYHASGEPLSHCEAFLENGLVVRQEFIAYDEIEGEGEGFSATVKYDKNNHLIERRHMTKSGELVYVLKHEYLAYDEHGNWTERLDSSTKEGDHPYHITIRQYYYY